MLESMENEALKKREIKRYLREVQTYCDRGGWKPFYKFLPGCLGGKNKHKMQYSIFPVYHTFETVRDKTIKLGMSPTLSTLQIP